MVSRVWVVDDDRSIRWVMEKALKKAGMDVTCFANADAVLSALHSRVPDVIVSDIRMPGTSGLKLLDHVRAADPEIPVIIMTAYSDLDSAVAAYQGGAFEYLPKPFDVDEAVDQVRRASERAAAREHRNGGGTARDGAAEIIGAAPAMQEVFRAIGRLARSKITVLINGESGTGKELVAKALHRHSPRGDGPFIALNMAAIPRDLLESELFGHERGAFTGAQTRRVGRFEQADGGTLFLDEIGDMPPELQTRLLRVLAEGEFYRVGGHTPVRVDVRIIAATHQNLEKLVSDGRFREDLFHRLNVIRIHIPALRERPEDIPLLMGHFLAEAAKDLGVEKKTLLHEAEAEMMRMDWPGNVRQLENTARWLTVMASGQQIHIADLPGELLQARHTGLRQAMPSADWRAALRDWANTSLRSGRERLLDEALPAFETTLIEVALAHTGGRRQDAARLLGWGRNTLTRKLKEHRMEEHGDHE